jgi:hypothetical protein
MLVVAGSGLAMLAGWRLASRDAPQPDQVQAGGRRIWRGASLAAGTLLLGVEGALVALLVVWHAATGDSSNSMGFLAVQLEAWGSYFGIGGLHLGWAAAYLLFVPLAVAALAASTSVLTGHERPVLVVAATWFLVALLLSIASLRLTAFVPVQLLVLVLVVIGTWPSVLSLGSRLLGPAGGGRTTT